jgi:hypothetical protein
MVPPDGRFIRTTYEQHSYRMLRSLYLKYGDYIFSFIYLISGKKNHSFEITRLCFLALILNTTTLLNIFVVEK